MPGAPNCQNPVWSPEERAMIGCAFSVDEARANHLCLWFPLRRPRSYKAIASEWYRQHPHLENRHTNSLDRELKQALDELEVMV